MSNLEIASSLLMVGGTISACSTVFYSGLQGVLDENVFVATTVGVLGCFVASMSYCVLAASVKDTSARVSSLVSGLIAALATSLFVGSDYLIYNSIARSVEDPSLYHKAICFQLYACGLLVGAIFILLVGVLRSMKIVNYCPV